MYGGVIMNRDQTYINDLLRQYRDGSISAKDRHELERMALDDPFLFDGMEGYTLNGDPNSYQVIRRIKSRTSAPKGLIISMRNISVAAGIVILIGGLFLINNKLNENQLEDFSQVATEEEDKEFIEPETMDQSIDSVADFIDTKFGDLADNAVPGPQMKEASETFENRTSNARSEENPTTLTQKNQKDQIALESEQVIILNDKGSATTDEPKETEIAAVPPKANSQVIESEKMAHTAPDAKPSKTEAATRSSATEDLARAEKKREIREEASYSFDNAASVNADPFGTANIEKAGLANGLNQRIISGIIRDNTGEPLIGANIVVPMTDIGISTDINGRFTLEVDSTILRLQIVYTGYADQVVTLDTSSSYDIVLDDEGQILDEVIVTGYAANVNEPQPSFVLPPGGRSAYKNAVKKMAQSGCNQTGKVKLKFTVTKYGEVTDFEIKKGLSIECDQRAIEIIKTTGRWDNQFDKDKTVRYTISF